MPITLTTLPTGATISASTMRTYVSDIEHYVNEQIVAADRTTAWMDSVHVFRPDFTAQETMMPGAHIWWNQRPEGRNVAAYHSQWLGVQPIPVVGLCRTVELPENINGTGYYLLVRASFTSFEFGGYGAGVIPSDYSGADQAARFRLGIGGNQIAATNRWTFRSSDDTSATPYDGRYYARKQHTMVWADDGTYAGTGGTVNVGVYCAALGSAGTTTFKHIIITPGNLVIRCRLR